MYIQANRHYPLGKQITFDSLRSVIINNGRTVNLGGRESATLKLLLDNIGEVVSKYEIHKQVWGKILVSETSLTKAISNIRKALAEFDTLEFEIKTMPKEGYALIYKDQPMEVIDSCYSYKLPVKKIKNDVFEVLPIVEARKRNRILGFLSKIWFFVIVASVIAFLV